MRPSPAPGKTENRQTSNKERTPQGAARTSRGFANLLALSLSKRSAPSSAWSRIYRQEPGPRTSPGHPPALLFLQWIGGSPLAEPLELETILEPSPPVSLETPRKPLPIW